MRVAIIGGGAAGMATAFYLSRQHKVVVYEKQSRLGGHVNTLGKNVICPALPEGLIIDHGVIEFLRDKSPSLRQLLSDLSITPVDISRGSSGFFLEDGKQYHLPGAIRRMPALTTRLNAYLKLAGLALNLLPIGWRRLGLDHNVAFGDILGHDKMSVWLRMLTMYAFSMPYETIDQFPLDLAMGALTRCQPGSYWMRIPGGMYTYFEAILAQSELTIHCDSEGLSVRRLTESVRVNSKKTGTNEFDYVVFATPPHAVLSILDDPVPEEQALFSSWQENIAETLIHTDSSLYEPWQPSEYTEFDVFEKNGGADAGYNAYLNHLIGLDNESHPDYFLAYNLEDRIDPATILHRQRHHTVYFSAGNNRLRIRQSNGNNRLFFAGAYLYDGLHEGAIQSALAVSDRLATKDPE